MGIAPIPDIHSLGQASAPLAELEVHPALAVNRSGRMADDAYKSSQNSDRGMEEEESDTAEEEASYETPGNPGTHLNFFA